MTNETTTPGRALIGRWGLTANPTGATVTWEVGDRTYLADVTGFYRDAILGAWMLTTRHFNGEPAPTVALAVVDLLNRDWVLDSCEACGRSTDAAVEIGTAYDTVRICPACAQGK